MAEKEYVNIQQFAFRMSVPVGTVRRALQERVIHAARRTQGGSWINWLKYKANFKKWCREAKYTPKKLWTVGKMLDLEALEEEELKKVALLEKADKANEEEEEPEEEEDKLAEMSLEDLEKTLRSGVSIDTAKKIRQIVGGLREIQAMKEADGSMVHVDEIVPKLASVGTLIKKSLRSIRPRVATQFAAMTDHHAIGRMLDKEIEITINQYNIFIQRITDKLEGK